MKKVCWFLALCGLCLTGCSVSQPSIVGKWVEKESYPGTYTFEFRPDSTCSYSYSGESMTFLYDGTFKFEDQKLTIIQTDAKVKWKDPAKFYKPIEDATRSVNGQIWMDGTVMFDGVDRLTYESRSNIGKMNLQRVIK
ncbi:MAG: hypothetical protein ACKVQS_00865 [Fimbriimonadaceae bacterium]